MKPHAPSEPAATDSENKTTRDEITRDKARTATALSASETVSRYGSANAEYVKGYRGVDNANGQRLAKGLKTVNQEKTGLPQKAGTSAEILATSRDNAENIINKSSQRSARTDDLSRKYGTNHPIADRVKTGEGDSTAYSQMKFEGSPKSLVDKIVSKDGDYAKYLDPAAVCEERATKHLRSAERADAKAQKYEASGNQEKAGEWRKNAADLRTRAETNREIATSEIKIEVPSEQVEPIKQLCRDRASSCLATAEKYESDALSQELSGNLDASTELKNKARELREEAKRCNKLEEQVTDSGVSQKEASAAASQPLKTTASNILKTSHRAGIEGAKYGAAIGGAISLLTNAFNMAQEKKQLGEAALDVTTDTVKAAALGYGTAFAGSALKGSLQQSSNQTLRTLAGTNAPALAVTICLSLGSSVKRYVTGEISEAQLLSEVGEKGAGMLSSSMMAALGQLAIPIPFIGAAVGGMIGYTLSSLFYQSALEAARGVELSGQQLERVRAIESAARDSIAYEQAALNTFARHEIPQLRQETQRLFDIVSSSASNVDDLAAAINEYATLLGKQLQFQSMSEFEHFMNSDQPLIL